MSTKDTLETMKNPPGHLETLGTPSRHQGHCGDLPALETMENSPRHLETLGTSSMGTKDTMGTPKGQPGYHGYPISPLGTMDTLRTPPGAPELLDTVGAWRCWEHP